MIRSLTNLTLAACLGLAALPSAFGEESPRLLPFQGRLTDQIGNPVPDSVQLVQFKIYDQPTGGNTVWAGEVHRTTVNGGLVNVILGTKTPLPSSTASASSVFGRQLYLEITIDINGDDAITLADPPMLPRQLILPTLYAQESQDSRKFGGETPEQFKARDSLRLGGLAPDQYRTGFAPVGSILPYLGDTNALPSNWTVCDGRQLSDPESLFHGSMIPDLRETFLRGTGGTNTVGMVGGRDTIEDHDHTFSDRADVDYLYNNSKGYVIAGGCCGIYNGPYPKEVEVSGTTSKSRNLDNRPKYFSVHYILRVR